MELSNAERLLELRQIAADLDRAKRAERGMTFDDWRNLNKSPTRGGVQTSLSSGVTGFYPGATSSRAPAGPRNRPSGEQLVGFNGFNIPGVVPNENQYTYQGRSQPPNWINDVDQANSWYSPFQPVWPFGPPSVTRPRDWEYPVGYNLNYVQPRMELMSTLRGMRDSWGVLATIIETRKDQLLRLPWTIQRKDKPRGDSAGVKELRKFFRRPDGKFSYSQWAHLILDDLFVIDAPSIYCDRDMGGRVRTAERLDGAYIFPLIDDAGRRPGSLVTYDRKGIDYATRQPAYQQIVYGLPMVNLSEDELIYAMMRPRPDMPVFGFSPVEQIMIEATEAIRKTFYQLEFWRSGSMPELIVTVPDQWSPRQIASFQAHFDALLSGQLSLKSKVRFLPGGMKPFDIKNASGESLWSERDEMLIRLACYAFSVSPTPFIKQNNRATANTAAQTAQEEGLYPLMSWWKDDVMDTLIQDKLGYDDIEFTFLPRPEIDLEKQAKIHQIKINTGEMTINEARAENGEEPYADGIGDVPLVVVGGGAMRLDQVIAGQSPLGGGMGDSGDQGARRQPQGKPTSVSSQPVAASRSNASGVPSKGPAQPNNAGGGRPTPVHKVSRKGLRQAAREVETNPTKSQKKVGNYKKGHVWLNGLNITIENAKGSKRGEKDEYGNKWEVKMPAAYGYIRGFIGADGDQIDCYLGKHPDSDLVFVIDQDKFDPDGKDKGFDEHKIMLAYRTAKRAMKDYLKSHFDGMGYDRASAVTVLSIKELKKWLKHGKLHIPISEQDVGHVIARRGDGIDLTKADTISMASNLTSYDQMRSALKPKRKKRKKHRAGNFGAQWKALVAE